jgi:hypothetical protein
VLRIGSRAAVTAGHYFAVMPQAPHHAFGCGRNRCRQRIHALQFEMRAFGKVLADAVN